MGSPTNAIIGLFMLWLVVDIVANIQFTQSKFQAKHQEKKSFLGSNNKLPFKFWPKGSSMIMQVGLVSFQLWQYFRSEWKEVSASIFYILIIIITIIIIIIIITIIIILTTIIIIIITIILLTTLGGTFV